VPLDVETHGIDAIPRASRTRGWFDVFAMVAGVNICLPMMMLGGVLVPRLSFFGAALAGLIGYAIAGFFGCLGAYPGVDHGLPTSVLTRITLGYPAGTWLGSGCTVITLVGWYAVQAELAGIAADGIVKTMTGYSNPLLMIGLMGGLNVFFAVMGFKWIQRLASFSVPALLVMSAWLYVAIARQYPFMELIQRPGDGGLSFLGAMTITVSGQIGGGFTLSDLSRYAKDHRSVWWGVLLGISPVATFMMSLGALSRLASGEWNPVLGIQSLGLGIPALLLVIFATWTTNDKNLYSSGLALTNLFPSHPRWRHTLILGLLGTVLGCFGITRFFTQWLITIGIVFAPLVGVVIADYFLVRRRRLIISEAYRMDGAYHYTKGVNLAALAAVAAGVVAGQLVPASALPPLVTLGVTMAVYVVGMRFFYPAQFHLASTMEVPVGSHAERGVQRDRP
jgi:NCS1 nucleoside transporter family